MVEHYHHPVRVPQPLDTGLHQDIEHVSGEDVMGHGHVDPGRDILACHHLSTASRAGKRLLSHGHAHHDAPTF